jgi:hypothetical protein
MQLETLDDSHIPSYLTTFAAVLRFHSREVSRHRACDGKHIWTFLHRYTVSIRKTLLMLMEGFQIETLFGSLTYSYHRATILVAVKLGFSNATIIATCTIAVQDLAHARSIS